MVDRKGRKMHGNTMRKSAPRKHSITPSDGAIGGGPGNEAPPHEQLQHGGVLHLEGGEAVLASIVGAYVPAPLARAVGPAGPGLDDVGLTGALGADHGQAGWRDGLRQ